MDSVVSGVECSVVISCTGSSSDVDRVERAVE